MITATTGSGLPTPPVVTAAQIDQGDPGNLQKFTAGQEGRAHQEGEGTTNVTKEINGTISHLLFDELKLEILKKKRETEKVEIFYG